MPQGIRFSMIDDCEDAWNEYVAANVTANTSTTRMMGDNSVLVSIAGAAAAGIVASEVVDTTITGTGLWAWVRTSANIAAGDFQILLDNNALCASPHETLDIPAITAGSFELVYIPFANPASGTAVISIALKMVVDQTVDIYLDYIRQGTALTTYTLQTTLNAEGLTATTYLHSELSGLIVPSYASLDVSGEVTESVDMIPGVVDVGELVMPLVEDYTNYLEGFWFKVLNKYAEIQINVLNGATVESYFWGQAKPMSAFDEISLIPDDIQRRGELTCVDLLIKLKQASVEDVVNMLKANLTATYNTSLPSGLLRDHYFVSIENMLKCIMAVGFGYTYAQGSVIERETGTDIQFDRTGAGDWIDWYQALVCIGDSTQYWNYFNSTSGGYLPDNVGSPYDLLGIISKNFGIVVRHTYSGVTGVNTIETYSRGKDFAADTFSVPSESVFYPESIPVIGITLVDHINSTYHNDYTIAGRAWVVSGRLTIPTTTTEYLVPSLDPDISFQPYWFGSAPPVTGTDNPDQWLFADDGSGTTLIAIQGSRHWDYNTQAYDSTESELAANLALYLYGRFGYTKRGYQRTYAVVRQGATNSHLNIQLFRSTSISDDISSRTFYAVATGKTLGGIESGGRLTVTWREL